MSSLYAVISFIQKTLFEYHHVPDTMTGHENTNVSETRLLPSMNWQTADNQECMCVVYHQ